jgi:hypothetical protein
MPIAKYLFLQYKLLNRKVSDFGLHPILCCFLVLIGFIGASNYLLGIEPFGAYLYVFIPMMIGSGLSETKRNDFLKACFSKEDYLKVRYVETYTLAFPFITYLCFVSLFGHALILLLASSILPILIYKNDYTWTLPTPFSKKPFEFAVGFRNTFYIIAIGYALAGVSALVANFNLGVFAQVLVLLTVMTYYCVIETDIYVWSYRLSARKFLLEKIKIAFQFSTALTIPIVLLLGIRFYEDVYLPIMVQFFGYIVLMTIVLSKYSSYPKPMSLPQAVLLSTTIYFPPILLALVPYFYLKSIERLKEYLKC